MHRKTGMAAEDEKRALRRHVRSCGVRGDSASVVAVLRAWDVWQQARVVALFAAHGDAEPDLLPLWADGKRLLLPRVAGAERMEFCEVGDPERELERGAFGVREPGSGCAVCGPPFDLILVPGLAFDRSGGRLGRGAGFFDRFLAGRPGAVVAGVAFDAAVVEAVPMAAHDVPMEWLVTESGVTACSRRP